MQTFTLKTIFGYVGADYILRYALRLFLQDVGCDGTDVNPFSTCWKRR